MCECVMRFLCQKPLVLNLKFGKMVAHSKSPPSLHPHLLSSPGCSGLWLGTLHSWSMVDGHNPGKAVRMAIPLFLNILTANRCLLYLWILFTISKIRLVGLFSSSVQPKIDLTEILIDQQQKVRYKNLDVFSSKSNARRLDSLKSMKL